MIASCEHLGNFMDLFAAETHFENKCVAMSSLKKLPHNREIFERHLEVGNSSKKANAMDFNFCYLYVKTFLG